MKVLIYRVSVITGHPQWRQETFYLDGLLSRVWTNFLRRAHEYEDLEAQHILSRSIGLHAVPHLSATREESVRQHDRRVLLKELSQ